MKCREEKELYEYTDDPITATWNTQRMISAIPDSLAPFFQEYDLSRLSPEKDAHTIIERTLQYGNRAELRWLFHSYGEQKIRAWVQHFGRECLPQPHYNFWQLIMETQP